MSVIFHVLHSLRVDILLIASFVIVLSVNWGFWIFLQGNSIPNYIQLTSCVLQLFPASFIIVIVIYLILSWLKPALPIFGWLFQNEKELIDSSAAPYIWYCLDSFGYEHTNIHIPITIRARAKFWYWDTNVQFSKGLLVWVCSGSLCSP